MRLIRKFGLRFSRDRRGAIGIVFAMTLPVLALGVGFGLNTVQLFTIKSNLQNALDSAVTSTARDLTTGVIPQKDARENVEAFLFANGGKAFASVDRIALDRVDVNRVTKIVSAAASVDVDVLFPLFGMNNHQHIVVESAALYSDKKIEVAMMLDVTGSMEGQKIEDLQEAATDAVEGLLKHQNSRDQRIRVALVPYANAVNAGDLATSSVFVERKWKDRAQALGNSDPRTVSASSRPDTCATERKGAYQYSDAGPEVSMVNRDLLLGPFASRYGDPTCPNVPVVPLTADTGRLVAAIGNLVADGGTAGHIGIQWTWYMLSHRWAGVLDRSERPARSDPDKVAKVAILMTDGEFNLSYFDTNDVDQVYNDKGKVATRGAAKRLCHEMKRDGIEIFTIGFDLDEPNAKETLAACASKDTSSVKHYYEAEDGDELDAAYQDIIRNFERLAVIK